MKSLELKIPPPLLAAALAAAIWGVSRITPLLDLPAAARLIVAAAIVLVGVGFSVFGMAAFRRAKTTLNPMKPELASSLVSTGVYQITRNPMYVGLLFGLAGWAVFLSSGWAFLGPLGFFFYMDRFQIIPEERVLAAMFGAEYAAYQAKVRRWL